MERNFVGGEGALWNCGDDKIPKPCEECMIIRFQAGLEFPNGTNANVDTGHWLHHVSITNPNTVRQANKGRWSL
jgi:hypothetical protein